MDIFVYIIHIIGIVSFAAAGAMIAIDNETDTFGVVFLSVITCFGGGLIRDVIAGASIGRHLPALFTDLKVELLICVCTALVVFVLAAVFKRQYVAEEETVTRINNILDALGIGVFSAAGTEAYLSQGALVAITMGMISSVGGSLTRDVILGGVPSILKKHIYALATLIGSAVYYVTAVFIIPSTAATGAIATVSCLVTIFAIRMCATYFKWDMPKAIDFASLREQRGDAESEITAESSHK